MITTGELAVRYLAATILVTCTLYSAYRLAWRFVDGEAFLLRWTAAGVIGMWLATVGFHSLFALSAFTLPAAVVAVALLAVAVGRLTGADRTSALLARDWELMALLPSEPGARRGLRVLFFFAPFAGLLLARSLLLPPLGWDWISYHGVRAALFVRDEAWTFPDAPGTWGLYRHYFAGSELLSAWTLLPFHSDLFASLGEWVQWVALGVAVAALGRLLRLGWEATMVSATAAMFIPTVRLMVPSGYTELELNFEVVACVALAVAFLRSGRRGYLLLTLAAAGVATGIKLTGAGPCLVASACAIVAALVSRRHRGRRTLFAVLLAVVLALLAPLPWLVLAVRDTGLPLSPMPISMLGVELGSMSPEMELYHVRGVSGAYTLRGELEALEQVFAPLAMRKEAMGLLTLIPLCVFPFGAIAGLSRRRVELLVPLLAALSVVALYYLPGMAVVRLNLSTSSSRFLIGLPVLAIPVSFLALVRRPRLERLYSKVLFGASAFYAIWLATSGMARFEAEYLVKVAAFVGLSLAIAYAVSKRTGWIWAGAAAAVVLGFAGTVQLHGARSHLRGQAVDGSTQLHQMSRYWSEAAARVDDPSTARTIAVTAGSDRNSDNWFAYFFLGRELQNRLIYVPITSDGRVVHVGPGVDRRAHADQATWLARMLASGATHVLSFRPQSIEQEWMESDPGHFGKLVGGTKWGLFSVLRAAELSPGFGEER